MGLVYSWIESLGCVLVKLWILLLEAKKDALCVSLSLKSVIRDGNMPSHPCMYMLYITSPL